MRIYYTLTSYPPAIGGAQLHFHALACALAHAHDVRVIAHWRDNRTDWLLGTTVLAPWNPRPYAMDGIPVWPVRLSLADRLLLAPLVALYYPLKDVALPGIARVLERRLLPLCSRPDIIHNGRIGREGISYASWRAARKLDVPFVLTPVHHPRWVGWFYRAYIRLYREADAVIALTQAEKSTLAALGVPDARIHVTGIGPMLSTRYDAVAFRTRYGIDGPMVLFVGQKFAYKNYEAVLAAAPMVWARRPDVRFVFIGPRTRHSQRVFAAYPDRRIVELGAVSLDEKTSAFAACEVFCMPSLQESFGGVFVEAWLMGKPVIGGDTPAVREVISDGADGFLVPPDPTQIADRILTLLADPALAQRMGRAGRQKALAHFTWDKLAAKTLAVYEGLLK